ncbi:Fur family transcriptional regulator [Marinivivus vitaminiproducens]|uniref:Fur family transcriptional regulator n=1 Tax=Marinivivus vitaminiproducens TaxID=3035935 RepID=UPI0027A383DD|nr:Fur family transcriptional regulator [Geminicoccaceae bacterium SCSIO 64248]
MHQSSVLCTHAQDWIHVLKAKALRVTAQRVAVLDFVHHHPHSDAEAIFQGIRPALPTVSTQAVHLIVQCLSGKGLIRRVSLPDSASARYETRIDDNHHHVQCIKCGRIEDVDCVVGEMPCLSPSDTHGMRIVEASVVFRGICCDCDTGASERSETP